MSQFGRAGVIVRSAFGRGGFLSRRLPAADRPPRRRPVGAVGDAVLRWGAPGVLQLSSNLRGFGRGGAITTIIWPDDEEEPLDEEEQGLEFQEISRAVTVVRVENPEDSEQFVDVERIDKISFRGPDGIVRTFILNNTPGS